MANDEPREVLSERETRSVFSAARKWGRDFVEHLEILYDDVASQLPAGATEVDFRRAMAAAIVLKFDRLGWTPDETTRFFSDALNPKAGFDSSTTWTSEKNARRLELIDKRIQQELNRDEAIELERLTALMRVHCDTEETLPLEGARRLHRQLLQTNKPSQPHD